MPQARCMGPAWDSENKGLYQPGKGPLPGGLYEIEAGTALDKLVLATGEWVFQYPGHEGKDPDFDRRVAEDRRKYQEKLQAAVMVTVPTQETSTRAKAKRQMSEAHKKKMKEARIAARARKQQEQAAA